MNTILHERQLEEYYCTLCYAVFDFKRRTVMLANSGLPYPIRVRRAGRRRAEMPAQIELPGVPLGSFPGSTYDEMTFDLAPGDLFVFCTDGVFEAQRRARHGSSAPTRLHRGGRGDPRADRRARSSTRSSPPFRSSAATTPPNDDMTAVAIKVKL